MHIAITIILFLVVVFVTSYKYHQPLDSGTGKLMSTRSVRVRCAWCYSYLIKLPDGKLVFIHEREPLGRNPVPQTGDSVYFERTGWLSNLYYVGTIHEEDQP